jgi:predicted RNase H-like HicB family nuclease
MKLYNYKVIIEESEEGGFYGECPAFPGCHVEGDTYEETIK